MKKHKNKTFKIIKPLIFFTLITIIVLLIVIFDLNRFLSLNYIKTQLDVWKYELTQSPVLFILGYFIIYVLVTTFSIPGAAVLTLLGGALFGLVRGTIIVSFASTLGATLSFLFSRFLLRDSIEQKFKEQYNKINMGLQKDGPFYLFALRLVPLFPFFMINLVMGITRIPILTYSLVSQIGMLPGTIVFINAGNALSKITDTSDIFNTKIWGAFALLAILPIFSKKIIEIIKHKKVYKFYKRPQHYDANVVVIGAGSGGLISSYIASTLKSTVYLIEKDVMGGDCLNKGCVPSKALIAASKFAVIPNKSNKFGIKYTPPLISFSKVMTEVHNAIKSVAPHDSIERYESLGVNCVKGEASILSPWEVKVGDRVIKTKSIILATGGNPTILDIPGLSSNNTYTSDTLWNNIKFLPKNLVVIGGGPIGCELSLAFSRFGSEVTLIQKNAQLLPREDIEVGNAILQSFQQEEIAVHTNTIPIKAIKQGKNLLLKIQNKEGATSLIPYDKVIVATGRKANTSILNSSTISLELTQNGSFLTNEYLQTSIPNIFAVGDAVGPHLFTHIASHMAWFAVVNALFGKIHKFTIDYSLVPAVTFTAPEVARVGITEEEAKTNNLDYEVVMYPLSELDRAIADKHLEGFIKIIVPHGKDKILGATIVAERAGEMLGEITLAMKHNIGLNKVLTTIHPYPTYIEAIKNAAGVWKKSHTPFKVLNVLEKIFKLSLRHPPSPPK